MAGVGWPFTALLDQHVLGRSASALPGPPGNHLPATCCKAGRAPRRLGSCGAELVVGRRSFRTWPAPSVGGVSWPLGDNSPKRQAVGVLQGVEQGQNSPRHRSRESRLGWSLCFGVSFLTSGRKYKGPKETRKIVKDGGSFNGLIKSSPETPPSSRLTLDVTLPR